MAKNDDKGAAVGSPDEDFVTRWSRRKKDSVVTADPADKAIEQPSGAEPEGAADPPVLTDADMPPIEDLDEDSDFSPFLSSGVSGKLRAAALRKLFRSAKFNICDGLDDYAEDYTKFEPLGDVITADMRHHMERALEKLAPDETETGAERQAQLEDQGEDQAASDMQPASPEDEAEEVEGGVSRESDDDKAHA